ncbi:unannotated protein [freshwater metagenome]|uniref:Unannotated protein n=1 Tax=freshwater metagenome TaxID=449393 RepID=A0A6J7XTC7_9ZZZZ|nr:hypothetical protein [Actinomycetota bacterium]
MSDTPREPSEDEKDLINAEFESMVAGLSLDESSPTTYLDELDARAREIDHNHFEEPHPKPVGFKNFFRLAKSAIIRWKSGKSSHDDGVEL